MTLAQKLTLAGVALICIILIIAFSPEAPEKADNRSGGQGAALAVVDRNLSNAAATGGEARATANGAAPSVAPSTPTAPASSPAAGAAPAAPAIAPGTPPVPPTGYDNLLARIREVDEVRDAAAGARGESDVPPVTPAPPLTAPAPATPRDTPSADAPADAPAAATPSAAAAESPAASTPAITSEADAPLTKPDAELPAAQAAPTLTVGPQPGSPAPAAADARTNRDEPGKPSDDILKQVADLPPADDLPASPDDAATGAPKDETPAPAKAEQPDSPVAPAAANAIVTKPATAAANTTTDADAPAPAAPRVAPQAVSAPPPAPADPISRTAAGRIYTVQGGDTFSSIAKAVYGAEKHWIELAEANRQIDPKKLRAGMTVKLPELPSDSPKAATATPPAKAPEAAPPAKAVAAKPAFSPTTHEVKAGETLSAISKQYFNTADHWRHLYLTNREAIGSDPGKLKAGTKLKVTAPVKD